MTEAERINNLRVPEGIVDCVLDTDAFNEIDDQFAIALMMKSGKLNVKALYAAPFFNDNSSSPEDGMEKSYNEILKLLDLMNKEDMKKNVFRGSRQYLTDEKTPVESPAARHLCELASGYSIEKPLYVVTIGAITDIASAILMKPEIAEKIVVVWLGGNDVHWGSNYEFNLIQDIAAVRAVFDSGCPFVQLPCNGVVSAFYTTQPELEYWIKGKNALCDYLYENTVKAAEQYAKGKVWSRIIWDVCAAAWLLNDGGRFMDAVTDHIPYLTYENRYAFDMRRHTYLRVTFIKRDALFGELFRVLAE